jgi:hypothetical protein
MKMAMGNPFGLVGLGVKYGFENLSYLGKL